MEQESDPFDSRRENCICQTPTPYYYLAKNCASKSAIAPKGNLCISQWYGEKMSTGAWQDEKVWWFLNQLIGKFEVRYLKEM